MDKIVALYSRVSTEMQRDKDCSIPNQKKWLEAKAKEHDFKTLEHFSDNGFSASDDKRPDYLRLLDKIEQNKVCAVIVYKYDRISRNTIQLLTLVDDLNKRKINFISIKENIDTTTSIGKLYLTFIAGLAEFERSQIVERITDSMWQQARNGKFCGGVRPYGYDVEKKNYVIIPKEAKIIQKVFDLFEQHRSFRYVTHWLNSRGIKTRVWKERKTEKERGGLTWASSSVRRLLTNPIYKGYFSYGKRAGNSTVLLPRNKWIIVKGNFEPIISEDQFDRVQASLALNRPYPQKRYGTIYLLSGLVRCGKCGGSMCGQRQINPQKKEYFYYRCHNSFSKGFSVCTGNIIRKETLENEVINEIIKRAKIRLDDLESFPEEEDPLDKIKDIEQSISVLETKKRKLIELFESNKISKEDIEKRYKKHEEDIASLLTAKNEIILERNPAEKNKRLNLLEEIKKDNVSLLLNSDKSKQEVLKELIKQVIVGSDGEIEVEIYEI